MKDKPNIRALADEVLERLGEMNYRDGTIAQYQRHYDDLAEYAANRGEVTYGLELSRGFLLDRYGIDVTIKIDFATMSSLERSVRGKIRVLDDYYVYGAIFARRSGNARSESLLTDEMRALLYGYVANCEKNEQSAYGISARRGRVRRFLQYLEASDRGCAAKIDALAVSGYVKTLLPKHEKSIAADLVALRGFLRWLHQSEKTAGDLSAALPKASRYNYPKIPSVWKRDDIASLLEAIDRTSPVGKRDFAILTLASRLGMRATDIRFLRLGDLDFTNKVISFAQHKTKNTVSFPMTNEIGWAMADWLRNGRSKHCAHDYVFASVQSPFCQVGNLNDRIARHARAAGISINGQGHHGMHSLRHTMASTLLVQGVALPLISDMLGHMDPRSTAVYLHCDIDGLRACAIDPDEEVDCG